MGLFSVFPAVACSLYVPNFDSKEVISDDQLNNLAGECLDSECKLKLKQPPISYYDYEIVINDDKKTTIATVRKFGVELYDFEDKDEIRNRISVDSLYEAYDKLIPYDLSLNKNEIKELFIEYFETEEEHIFDGIRVEILSNEGYTTIEKALSNVEENNKNEKRCSDQEIIRGDKYYILVNRDRGVCELESDPILCPKYVYNSDLDRSINSLFKNYYAVALGLSIVFIVTVVALSSIIIKKKSNSNKLSTDGKNLT